jgi:murein L,D-transpeptidase YcbB/YkuD
MLKRPIAVHVVYNTAWVDEVGSVQFRDDSYDRDRLTRRSHSWGSLITAAQKEWR